MFLTPDDVRTLTGYRRGAWKDFLVPMEDLRSRRAMWMPGCGPNESGIYFLFLRWALVYVGQSVNVADRLRGHRMAWMDGKPKGKDFTGWSAIKVPGPYLHEVEIHYIKKHKPAFNVIGKL